MNGLACDLAASDGWLNMGVYIYIYVYLYLNPPDPHLCVSGLDRGKRDASKHCNARKILKFRSSEVQQALQC